MARNPQSSKPLWWQGQEEGPALHESVYPEVWTIKSDVTGSCVGDKLKKIEKLIIVTDVTNTS